MEECVFSATQSGLDSYQKGNVGVNAVVTGMTNNLIIVGYKYQGSGIRSTRVEKVKNGTTIIPLTPNEIIIRNVFKII